MVPVTETSEYEEGQLDAQADLASQVPPQPFDSPPPPQEAGHDGVQPLLFKVVLHETTDEPHPVQVHPSPVESITEGVPAAHISVVVHGNDPGVIVRTSEAPFIDPQVAEGGFTVIGIEREPEQYPVPVIVIV